MAGLVLEEVGTGEGQSGGQGGSECGRPKPVLLAPMTSLGAGRLGNLAPEVPGYLVGGPGRLFPYVAVRRCVV